MRPGCSGTYCVPLSGLSFSGPTDTPESRTSISVEVSPEMRYLALPCTGIILCRALEVLSDLAPPGHQAHSLKEGASVLQQGPTDCSSRACSRGSLLILLTKICMDLIVIL